MMMMMMLEHRFRDLRRRCRDFLGGDNRTNGTNGMLVVMRMLLRLMVMVMMLVIIKMLVIARVMLVMSSMTMMVTLVTGDVGATATFFMLGQN